MTSFDSRAAAGLLVGLGALYLVATAVTGRSARAEAPPDLSPPPTAAALDAWKAAALLLQEPQALVVDLRPTEAFERYHLPRAVNLPGASAPRLLQEAGGRPVLVYAGKDEVAQQAVAELRRGAGAARAWYLADGARAWYLAFSLPVPVFAEAPPPGDYPRALETVRRTLDVAATAPQPEAVRALETLVRLNYQPTLLGSGKKAARPGGGGKKIAGGCG